MLTIKGEDVAKDTVMKYTLTIGATFLLITYLTPKYFKTLLLIYVISFILMMIRVIGKRRITMLKIQGKRLDIYFGGWHSEMKSFQLKDLQGRFAESISPSGKQRYTLELSQNSEIIGAVKTQDGFEGNRLRTLLSLLRPEK